MGLGKPPLSIKKVGEGKKDINPGFAPRGLGGCTSI